MTEIDSRTVRIGAEGPEGLRYVPDFLMPDQERALLDGLEPLDWDGRGLFRRRCHIVRRRELDFLSDYGRGSRKLSPGRPLPEFLEPLRTAVAQVVGIAPENIGQVITALYRPEAGIDWHTDSIKAFGDVICGVSLGSACTMQFRQNKTDRQPYRLTLAPRSLLIMQGPARWDWQHHIPVVKQLRYSVTLRTLKQSA